MDDVLETIPSKFKLESTCMSLDVLTASSSLEDCMSVEKFTPDPLSKLTVSLYCGTYSEKSIPVGRLNKATAVLQSKAVLKMKALKK